MPKWPSTKKTPTYSFPPDTRKYILNPIKDATKQWAKVTYFKFTRTTTYDETDIKISFQFKDHGDWEPFDGPLGISAHASAPTEGRLNFNGDKRWINGVAPDEFDLETVEMHELEHILGFGHNSEADALMYPNIPPGIRKKLGQDDIEGIKALYQT
ncbi:metalloendoproteinase 1-like [Sesamum indicum]|uniref:Metalloendoproteinase 1-like n=1 Tax=Sesamum indicum TaxID=4182 RepID=A0A6I9TWF9_SESIN|nr:metalloendoproteinase 1-like [Sesamum indicum]